MPDDLSRRCRNTVLSISTVMFAASFLLPASVSRGGHPEPGFMHFVGAILMVPYFPVALVALLPNLFMVGGWAALVDQRPGRAAALGFAGVPIALLSGGALMGMACCGPGPTLAVGFWAWVGSMLVLGAGSAAFARVIAPHAGSASAYPVGSAARTG